MRDRDPVDRIVAAMGTTGEAMPGLGHPLYPDGDPRYRALRDHIAATRPEAPVLDVLDRLEVAALRAGLPLPNVDCGLAALTLAFDLIPRSGELMFAVARTAGWVAHAIEALHEKPLRLRAAYVGPEPADHA